MSAAEPVPGLFPIDHGVVDVRQDLDCETGFELRVDGVLSSYVDLADPEHLDFEYVRWIAGVLESIVPTGTSVDALHLGGAGCTLPRWLAHVRPGSGSTVVEYDGALVRFVRSTFAGLDWTGVDLVEGEGFAVAVASPPAAWDVVVRDAFGGGDGDPVVPEPLRSRQFAAAVHHTLRPGGCYVANLTDRPPLLQARREAATLLGVFAHVAVVTEPGILRGRRYGNLLLVAGDAELPIAAIARRVGTDAVRASVVVGERLTGFVGGASPYR